MSEYPPSGPVNDPSRNFPKPLEQIPTHTEILALAHSLEELVDTIGRHIDNYRTDFECGVRFKTELVVDQACGEVKNLLRSPQFRWPQGWPAELCNLLKQARDFFRGPSRDFDSPEGMARVDELGRISMLLDDALDSCPPVIVSGSVGPVGVTEIMPDSKPPGEKTATDEGLEGAPRSRTGHQKTSSPKQKSTTQPPPEAFLAYSLYVDTGWDQEAIARKISEQFGRLATQGQVSRWVKAVKEWRGNGNPWPEGMYTPKSIPTDPSKLDKGPREQNYARRKSID